MLACYFIFRFKIKKQTGTIAYYRCRNPTEYCSFCIVIVISIKTIVEKYFCGVRVIEVRNLWFVSYTYYSSMLKYSNINCSTYTNSSKTLHEYWEISVTESAENIHYVQSIIGNYVPFCANCEAIANMLKSSYSQKNTNIEH